MINLRFRVATYLVCLLAALAFIRTHFEPWIPPLPPNALEGQPGDYLEAAVHQPIHWEPFKPEVLRTAAKQSKPTLLVIGAPWSKAARAFDTQVFPNLEIANLINQNFLPVRIDAAQEPEWLSCICPLSRLNLGIDPAFQIYVLDTRGRVLRKIDSTVNDVRIDYNDIHDQLVSARDAFADEELKNQPSEFAGFEQDDSTILRQGNAGAMPDFNFFGQTLLTEADAKFGGFKDLLIDRPNPYAWEYLLRTGQLGLVSRTLDPYLCSPQTDAVRGGFYCRPLGEGRALFSFDQVTVRDAEMTDLLAEAGAQLSNPAYTWLAATNLRTLLTQATIGGTFGACRSDEDRVASLDRSYRFSAQRISANLPPDQAQWAIKNLGIDSPENPASIPYITSLNVPEAPEASGVFEKLTLLDRRMLVPMAPGLLDANGKSIAALLRTARLLGDKESERRLLAMARHLSTFRRGDDVRHGIASAEPGTYLGDYLGFADAALASYETSGDQAQLEQGLAVLKRACTLFAGPTGGTYQLSEHPILPYSDVPELTDDIRESCSAQMIRLLFDYGRLTAPNPESQDLIDRTSESIARFCNAQIPVSCRMSGYYCAATSFADPQCAFTVGPEAQELADQLYRRRPNRLVAATHGPVRPDLSGRKPGIYIVNGSVVAGPYTVEQAVKLIPLRFAVGS